MAVRPRGSKFSMLEYDFQNSIGYWLCTTAHGYECAMNELLTRQGITFRQCQVLAWLALEGEMSQTELASRMRIEPPTLVRVLDRMERDGLVSRSGCPDDRRRKLIAPLPKAKPMWKKIVATAEAVRLRAVEGLSNSEVIKLRQLLTKVQQNLQAECVNVAAKAPAR